MADLVMDIPNFGSFLTIFQSEANTKPKSVNLVRPTNLDSIFECTKIINWFESISKVFFEKVLICFGIGSAYE